MSTQRIIFFLFFLTFSLFTFTAHADDYTVTGRIIDEEGKPVLNAKISVEGSAFTDTDKNGNFSITLSKQVRNPKEIRVLRKDMKVRDFTFRQDTRELKVIMQNTPGYIQGQVIDVMGAPLQAASVTLEGIGDKAFATDFRGFFGIQLPTGAQLDEKLKFKVNDQEVPLSMFSLFDKAGFVLIRVNPKGKTSAKTDITVTNQGEEVVTVTVYDESYMPLANIRLTVDGTEYQTDQAGRFAIVPEKVKVENFSLDGYEIATFDFDGEGNYVFIVVKSEASGSTPIIPTREPIDSIVIDYRNDFYSVINELELRKQVLAERSTQIRSEMERIAEKLSNEKNLTENQREKLRIYLKNLETALIQNDVEYEDAQEKSQKLVDQLRFTLKEKEEEIETKDAINQRMRILLAFIVLGLLLTSAIAGGFYMLARKIRNQKKEIERQRDEVTQAYNNITTISEIGRQITSVLDFKTLVSSINANMMSLIDAAIFGVGIYNEHEQKIEFMDFIANGHKQLYHYESVDDDRKFSVWCIKNKKEVIINDLAVDYKNYLKVKDFPVSDDMPRSLIYLPLIRKDKAIGVITVQNFRKNAYKQIDTEILQALASYVSIALDNSNAYEIIKRKNKDITDSIRYAQTIQEAILPNARQMSEAFRDYFVVFRPKDIVSGDFFWMDAPLQGRPYQLLDSGELSLAMGNASQVFFAVVDCTGHGVPGGFMSMIANHLLSEIVNIGKLYDPAAVLEQLDVRVRQALKQYEKVNDDGMDICLCLFEKLIENGSPTGQTKITFAGARRSLYYVTASDNKLHAIKGDRASIGGLQRKDFSFSNHEIVLSQGDMVYMLTDGMADQNNPDRQKFSTRNLRDLLEANARESAEKQREAIESTLDAHMNGSEQRDDITIVGIRI